jgi:uncharacterized protein YjbI with pentapeptide repeats
MDTGGEHSEQQTKQSRWGFRGMTVRDWLQLLIVPLALVVISFLFAAQQDQRQQQTENQRAEAERELANQRAQDEALQSYLDQMSTLLLEKDLRSSEESSEVRTLARARTLTVLGRLDPSRRTAVMRFLVEAELVQSANTDVYKDKEGKPPIIELSSANLSGANLGSADLDGAHLAGADLSNADLEFAYLSYADLNRADLSGANLSFAKISYASFAYADLSGANLHNALLLYSDLGGANLSNANLTKALLTNSHFDSANLRDSKGWTKKELAGLSRLDNATMPNGQKYEDWLKDREKGQQDE